MRITLLMLVSLVALTALSVGLLLVYTPDGSSLGLSNDILESSPFKNFFITGLFLAVVIGGCSLISIFFMMIGSEQAYKLSLASGIILAIWIIVQMLLVPYYNWFQAVCLVIGILISLLSYQLLGKAAF